MNTAIRPTFRGFVKKLNSDDVRILALKDYATDLPKDPCWKDIRAFLNNKGADDTVIIGARLAWRAFQNARRPTSLTGETVHETRPT